LKSSKIYDFSKVSLFNGRKGIHQFGVRDVFCGGDAYDVSYGDAYDDVCDVPF
jgi:hypothetical protein